MVGVRAAAAARWFWVLGAVEEAPSALAVLLMAKEMAGIFPCNDRRRSRGMVLGGGKSMVSSSAFESLSSESVNEEGGICGGGGGTTGGARRKEPGGGGREDDMEGLRLVGRPWKFPGGRDICWVGWGCGRWC